MIKIACCDDDCIVIDGMTKLMKEYRREKNQELFYPLPLVISHGRNAISLLLQLRFLLWQYYRLHSLLWRASPVGASCYLFEVKEDKFLLRVSL